MARFVIRPEHEPLVKAAIGLGDWILREPELTEDERRIVLDLQDALRRLPEDSPGCDLSYGFVAEWSLPHPEMGRGWYVALDPLEGLQFFSVFNSPDLSSPEQAARELSFALRPDWTGPVDDYYQAEWIAEVSDSDRFRREGATLSLDVESG